MASHYVVLRCATKTAPYVVRVRSIRGATEIGKTTYLLENEVSGGEDVSLSAPFEFTTEYACPHCDNRGLFECMCGKLNCWDLKVKHVTCAWCGDACELNRSISSINAGSG